MTLFEIFSKVLNMSLTASVVIGIVLVARLLLRKSPKSFSYALWVVVLFRLLCPVSLPSPVSLLGLFDAPVAEAGAVASRVEYVSAEPESNREMIQPTPVRTEVPEASEPRQAQQTEAAPTVKTLSAAEIAAYIWAAGTVVMLLLGIGSELRFRVHLTGACRLKGNIYLVDHIDSAFVAGLVFPKIYLPSDLPEKQRDYIIAHEQYHIRRLDPVAKHLAFGALCIHWFNPLVWAAFILSGRDMEMSCDEAVIKKLGEGIRADYSASLLQLAMGRRIIAGSPLAFGEGDTKGRIKNMANWKKPKKWVSALSFAVCAVILTACAANPEKNVVVSKNDGAFDAGILQPAIEEHAPDATQPVVVSNEFYSTDGSVRFVLNLDLNVRASNMPVVKVTPHTLTAEDSKRVASVLFGDIQGYESPPLLDPQYSKADIRECIARWSPYTSGEGVKDLYGMEDEFIIDLVKGKIETLNLLYDSAPDEIVHEPCKWEFQNEVYYTYAKDEADEKQDDAYCDAIMAKYKMNGVSYSYEVVIRDKRDYKLNVIFAYLDAGDSPMSLDETLYRALLCRTAKPTEEQISAVQEKAQNMLDQMGLGKWMVNRCYVECNEEAAPMYIIHVSAVPVLEGVPAAPQPQLTNLTSDTTYASNYYISETLFEFSANGELVDFRMSSPIDIQEVVNDNTAVMGLEELLEIAENHLKLSDSQAYNSSFSLLFPGEELDYTVNLSDFSYGLLRVKMPETDESYYYVPGVMLEGYLVVTGKDSGNTYYISETAKPFVALNAVDGSVIALNNE